MSTMTPEQIKESLEKRHERYLESQKREEKIRERAKQDEERKKKVSNDPIYAEFGFIQEDPTDEENEHKVITEEDRIDAWYTPKDTRKREDMLEDRERRYEREMEANQQGR